MSGIPNATPLTALNAVSLDTETTGLDATKDRVVQIGAVGLRGSEIQSDDRFETLVNPGVAIPPIASSIHGIHDADLAGAPAPAQAVTDLAAFVGSRVVIGHSIAFDLEILAREASRAEFSWPVPRALDIRPLALAIAPSLADYSLDALCAWLEIDIEGRHTAMGDAVATSEVFIQLIPKLRERNIRTLAEAEAACQAVLAREATPQGLAAGSATGKAAPRLMLDSYAFAHRISDVMSAPPAVVPGAFTVREALSVLLEKGISSVFVEDGDRIGIATERNMLRALAADNAGGFALNLAEIMSAPLQSVDVDDPLYRAIGRIERMNIRHLGVVDRTGALVGAVTTRNLLRHRASAAMALGDEIEAAEDAADLGAPWSKVSTVARSLLDQDLRAGAIAGVISAEICALTRKAAILTEERLQSEGKGAAPHLYAVLVLGSAGRGESLIAADQDNAIVIGAEEVSPEADAWFTALGEGIADILDGVGVVYCKGGVMGKNAAWRRSTGGWRDEITHWVNRQNPADLLNVDIFFDALTVHGQEALGQEVWEHAYEVGSRAPSFLRALEGTMADWRPPLGLFGGFQTGDDGRVDLKLRGLFPLVSVARILSIKANSPARSTAARFRAAAAAGKISDAQAEALEHAHQIILAAILDQQIADVERGRSPGPKVDPRRFDKPALNELKDAVRRALDAVQIVREGIL
ncbi:MAG: DUF294 nucleotidyltransferase-like domain-containing protein [Paracoccaceae bacterium]|nr:DUF294 nucleotidyltransferase-like domain-containing protein [Paracoccaceae bacterium]